MKDYNEMAKAVFERRDEYVAKRKKQRANLLKAGVPLCALVLVCLLSLTLRLDRLPEAPIAPTEPSRLTESTEPVNTGAEDEVTKPQFTPDKTEPYVPQQKPVATDPVEQDKPKPTGAVDATEPGNNDYPIATDCTSPEGPSHDRPDSGGPPKPTDPWIRPDEPKPTLPMIPGYPEYTEPVCTEPAAPGIDQKPTEPPPTDPTEPTEPTESTEPRPTGPLEISVNGESYTVQTGDMVTYTVELYADVVLDELTFGVTYGDELKPVELRDYGFTSEQRMKAYMPNLNDPDANLYIKDTSIYLSGTTYHTKKDFTQKKVLATFSFIAQYAGSTEIKLKFSEMHGEHKYYFSSYAGQLIFQGFSYDEHLEVTPEAEVVYPVAPELPYEVLEDDTPFTYPEETSDGDLLINCDGRTYSANVGDKVTYVVEMKAYELFEDIQLYLMYDKNILKMTAPVLDENISKAEAFPNMVGSYVGGREGRLNMHASNLDGYDFRKRKELMVVEFTVLEGGEIDLNMVMQEMGKVSGYDYFEDDIQESYTDIKIYQYILVN